MRMCDSYDLGLNMAPMCCRFERDTISERYQWIVILACSLASISLSVTIAYCACCKSRKKRQEIQTPMDEFAQIPLWKSSVAAADRSSDTNATTVTPSDGRTSSLHPPSFAYNDPDEFWTKRAQLAPSLRMQTRRDHTMPEPVYKNISSGCISPSTAVSLSFISIPVVVVGNDFGTALSPLSPELRSASSLTISRRKHAPLTRMIGSSASEKKPKGSAPPFGLEPGTSESPSVNKNDNANTSWTPSPSNLPIVAISARLEAPVPKELPRQSFVPKGSVSLDVGSTHTTGLVHRSESLRPHPEAMDRGTEQSETASSTVSTIKTSFNNVSRTEVWLRSEERQPSFVRARNPPRTQ